MLQNIKFIYWLLKKGRKEMSYLALYRQWRPMVFRDVVEQEHVIKTLSNSIMTSRIAHAYLFCGTRGTGKTTTTKSFSRAENW